MSEGLGRREKSWTCPNQDCVHSNDASEDFPELPDRTRHVVTALSVESIGDED